MPVPRAIVGLMRDSVTIETRSADDAYGTRSYAAGVAVKCRVNYGTQRVWSSSGEEVTSSVQVYLSRAVSGLTTEARVTLPDGSKPPIRSVQRHTWHDGSQHEVIYF